MYDIKKTYNFSINIDSFAEDTVFRPIKFRVQENQRNWRL